MDGWTDRQTELQWLRCATAVAAVAHKKSKDCIVVQIMRKILQSVE